MMISEMLMVFITGCLLTWGLYGGDALNFKFVIPGYGNRRQISF
jgi:hypothetical protein